MFDIEVDGIEPGTVIEQSTAEKIIEVRKVDDPMEYQFRLMQLSSEIERMLWRIGKQYTVRISGGDVQVLTHEEASRYNASRFENAIEKLKKCNRRLSAVDVGVLSKEAREDHGRSVIKQSHILAMVKAAKRDLALGGQAASVPKMTFRLG